ncbi:MAG: InlB B-repeat-containing protein [Anaerovoracaceae bacterium]|nr:InlB B-repeat-containing protein [Anaerovoracaceae bacterium]
MANYVKKSSLFKLAVIMLAVVVVFAMSLTTNSFAQNTKEDLAKAEKAVSDAEKNYEDTLSKWDKLKKDVEKAEKEKVDAEQDYAAKEEAAALAQSGTGKKNPDLEAKKAEYEKQLKILNDAEARLAKVKADIAAGQAAVEAYNSGDMSKKAEADAAWAKNDEWETELTEAQKALNTIKADNYLGDAKAAYEKAKKEADKEAAAAKDKAVEEMNKAAGVVKEKTSALDKLVKERSDAKEAFENAQDTLDNAKANLEKILKEGVASEPTVKVNFDANGGEPAPKAQEVEVGKKAVKPADPKKDGYKFLGWFSGSYGWNFDKDTVGKSDLTLVAQWEKEEVAPPTPEPVAKVKVSFDANGGEPTPEAQEVEVGKKAVKPADPKKDGYKFLGWFSGSYSWNFDKDTVGESDLTLVALWEKEPVAKVKVSFDANGGEPTPKAQEVEAGKKAVKPADPKKDGYNFLGWLSGSYSWNFDKDTVGKSDLTLVALWEKEEVTPATPVTPAEPGTPGTPKDKVKPGKTPAKTVETKTVKANNTPNTGDSADLAGYGIVLLAGTVLVAMTSRKKNIR